MPDRAEEYKATYSCQAYTLDGRDNEQIDKLKVLIKDLDRDTLKEEGNERERLEGGEFKTDV